MNSNLLKFNRKFSRIELPGSAGLINSLGISGRGLLCTEPSEIESVTEFSLLDKDNGSNSSDRLI